MYFLIVVVVVVVVVVVMLVVFIAVLFYIIANTRIAGLWTPTKVQKEKTRGEKFKKTKKFLN